MLRFHISGAAIDVEQLARDMHNQSSGAFVTFEGWVRDTNDGKSVTSLEYEVFHALAQSEGEAILREAQDKHGFISACVVHREGRLALGDCAVWVGVTARHRGEAFAACRLIIDEVKRRLPIWKKESYVDGGVEWVNCRAHHHEQPMPLREEDIYARQMRLPEIGAVGQAKLKAARVLVVGAGGLGCAALPALAAAGVGVIGIAEHDVVEASNLHRQTLYKACDIGKQKAPLAAEALRALNPFCQVTAHVAKVTAATVRELVAAYDIVLDCTDNFAAKYLLNDAAVLANKILIQASLYRFEGQLISFVPGSSGGCLRCLWPEPPAAGMVGDCATAGVIGAVPAMFGALQAHEAIRAIVGLDLASACHLFSFDLTMLASRSIRRQGRRDCAICGDHPRITALSAEAPLGFELFVTPQMSRGVLCRSYLLIDVREADEREVQPLPEAAHRPFSRFDIADYPAAKDSALLAVCAHGVRSFVVVEQLRAAGWSRAVSLHGGIGALPPIVEEE